MEQACCSENVEQHVDSSRNHDSSLIGQLGEAEFESSIISVTSKLTHSCTHGKHNHNYRHKLRQKNQYENRH